MIKWAYKILRIKNNEGLLYCLVVNVPKIKSIINKLEK